MVIRPKTTNRIVNFFGGLGYFFCMLQWLFTIAIYANFIKDLLAVKPEIEKQANTAPVVIDLATNMPATIIAIIITLAVIILSLYVFIKIPSAVVKTSQKVVHETAEYVAPVVLRIQHIDPAVQTPKKLKVVKVRIIITIKILVIIIPVALAIYSQFTSNRTLDFSIVIYGSIVLAAVSTLFFTVQYVLSKLLHVPRQFLW